MPKQDADDLYEFIRRISIPRMQRFYEYESEGTICFSSGESYKTGNIIFKVYKKDKELQHKGYQLNSLIGTLRFEVAFRRRKLRYDYKHRKKLKNRESFKLLKEFEELSCMVDCDVLMGKYETGCEFETLSSILYQNHVLYDFMINKCHLNKHITTKDNLNIVIQNSFSPNKQHKYLKVISYLNGEIDNINMCGKTLNAFKKRILDTGYHYLYYEKDLGVIGIEKTIIESLESINGA